MTGPSYDDRAGSVPPEQADGRTAPGYGDPAADATAPPQAYGSANQEETTAPPTTTRTPEKVPARTRVSGLWVASISAVVVLLLLLIFILQNGDRVKINIFGANPTLPLGVALLLAAVLGALLVALIGAARVVQLRHTTRRMAKKSR
jgi:uncharacterized integral membrane protein